MNIDTSKKLAGILVPAFALRRKDDLGIGDTEAVKEAIDFCNQNNFGILQLLPVNESGGDNSPYNAISAMALDPVYVSFSASALPEVPGFSQEDLNDIQISATGAIDYIEVKHNKFLLLRRSFDRFEADKTGSFTKAKSEFSAFEQDNANWLPDYCLFRALIDLNNGDARWPFWRKEFSSIESARKWISQSPQKDKNQNCRFFSYIQWVAHKQWTAVKEYASEKEVRLIGDIPFGVSRYSADVWAHKDLFELDWSGGAPPERFFQSDKFTVQWGQNWGIPLYKWSVHEKNNYCWWRDRVEQVGKYFHGFRFDHVLGFFRIYSFPWLPEDNQKFIDLTEDEAKEFTGGKLPGFKPRDDKDPESALLNCREGETRLKAILERAADMLVIAEDLGTVPAYVRPSLAKMGMPGFSIPIFERNEEDRSFVPSEELPVLSLATYGTHDNEPIASYYEKLVEWWHGEDGHEGWLEVQRLMRFLNLDENNPPEQYTDDLACTFFRVLFSSPCWLAILMITDLLGTKQCFNRPGTSNASNWSERLEKPLNEYTSDINYAKKISCAREAIVQTKRLPYSFKDDLFKVTH